MSGLGSAGVPGPRSGLGHLSDPGPVPDPRAARASVGEIEGLRDDLWSRGVAKVVLAGAGGVGVVAEALAGDGARLTVLDGCDPVQLAEALAGDLHATVLVVSAPPDADTAAVEIVWDELAAAFAADGLDPADHTVLVAPPDHALVGRAAGAPVVPGPADLAHPGSSSHMFPPVQGRHELCEVGAWAALTPYALVPAGLAGADVGKILARALAVPAAAAAEPSTTVAARLAATDVIALAGPLAETLAQLLGTLEAPVEVGPAVLVVAEPGAPGWDAPGALTVGPAGARLRLSDDAAAEVLLWQRAVAQLGAVPVTGSSGRAGVADGPVIVDALAPVDSPAVGPPDAVVGAVEIHGPGTSPAEALELLVTGAGTLAVHAHLDRNDDASAALLRTELSTRTGLVTAFGWGARTAPLAAAVLQLTGAGPDGPAARHQLVEAAAEAVAMERRGIRVLRLHLTDRLVGLVELVRAIQDMVAVHPRPDQARPADLT